MKKFRVLISVLCLATMVFSSQALATSHDIYFRFTDLTNQYSATYGKSDSDQNWYLSLDEYNDSTLIHSTLSSTNILGCRMRASSGATVDVYHTFSNYVKNYSMTYTATVSSGQSMYLAAKQDSTSTSDQYLVISGHFAP